MHVEDNRRADMWSIIDDYNLLVDMVSASNWVFKGRRDGLEALARMVNDELYHDDTLFNEIGSEIKPLK